MVDAQPLKKDQRTSLSPDCSDNLPGIRPEWPDK